MSFLHLGNFHLIWAKSHVGPCRLHPQVHPAILECFPSQTGILPPLCNRQWSCLVCQGQVTVQGMPLLLEATDAPRQQPFTVSTRNPHHQLLQSPVPKPCESILLFLNPITITQPFVPYEQEARSIMCSQPVLCFQEMGAAKAAA